MRGRVWLRIGWAAALAVALTVTRVGTGQQPHTPTDMSLYVDQFGQGPPLIALHGFGGSTYSWHAVRNELSACHTVYAFDLKGHGRSPKPTDARYAAVDQAALVESFIDSHRLTSISLVGHSFGGGVALAIASNLAVRSPSVLSRLVLIDAASYRQDLPWFITALKLPVFGWLSQHGLPVRSQVRRVLNTAYHDDGRVTDEQVEAYAAPLRLSGGKYALRETAKQIVPGNIDEISKGYPSIAVPTLVIWGRHDAVVPLVNGERLAREIPNARLVVVDDAGHIPHEERPAAVASVLRDFLAEGTCR
jgi:pimeloyl-ACP methyl ester carboxylesterase